MPRRRVGRVERHGAGWRFQVFVNGERIRRSFATQELAQRALDGVLAQIEHDAKRGLLEQIGVPTVDALVGAYYERRKQHLELSTQARYEEVLRKYVSPLLGELDARDIAASPVLLQDFVDAIPPGQARKAVEVLGPAFRMAADNGVIASDPTPKIRRPRRFDKNRKKEIPTPAEIEKIVIAAYEQDVWWGYFVDLVATLGLRRAEACALRWEDFDFPAAERRFGVIHVRRAVGKRNGGIYLKAPKSGLERDVLASVDLFAGLETFRQATGWLFPGRPPRPAGQRLLADLLEHGGRVECPLGRAGSAMRRRIGTNSSNFSDAMTSLISAGLVVRDATARRTFRVELTGAGRRAARAVVGRPDDTVPMHPDTAGHRFEEMAERLGLRGPSGRLFTLHSLRHYRATHLYNASKDWVQVAKYLGHTSPAITMDLYANNVVSATQELLAESARGV